MTTTATIRRSPLTTSKSARLVPVIERYVAALDKFNRTDADNVAERGLNPRLKRLFLAADDAFWITRFALELALTAHGRPIEYRGRIYRFTAEGDFEDAPASPAMN
jgi:hypothetical protein